MNSKNKSTTMGDIDIDEAVQIVTCKNHQFELQLQALREILDVDDLKQRSIVVVSIAGSYRTGKSFLLNFFIKYLRAQVSRISEINIFITILFNTIVSSFFHSINHMVYPIGLVMMCSRDLSGAVAKIQKLMVFGFGPKFLPMILKTVIKWP